MKPSRLSRVWLCSTGVLAILTLWASPAQAQRGCTREGCYYYYYYYYYYTPPPDQTRPGIREDFISLDPYTSRTLHAFDRYRFTGSPAPGVTLDLYTDPVGLTGGHNHDDGNRPASTLSPDECVTDSNGQCAFTITSTYVSQTEYVGACDATNEVCNEKPILIGYVDLASIPNSSSYSFQGAKAWHPNNTYATQTTIAGIQAAIGEYYGIYPNASQLGVNDAALQYGGWFDINQNWTCPHKYHGRGTSVDVNFVYDSASDLRQACVDHGANFTATEPGPTNVHCEWPDSIQFFSNSFCPGAPGAPPPNGR